MKISWGDLRLWLVKFGACTADEKMVALAADFRVKYLPNCSHSKANYVLSVGYAFMAALDESMLEIIPDDSSIIASNEWHLRRFEVLQKYQQELPEPYRTDICDILANGFPRSWVEKKRKETEPTFVSYYSKCAKCGKLSEMNAKACPSCGSTILFRVSKKGSKKS